MFNNTIGWKNLGELYDNLFGLGMTIDVDDLKCKGQCSRLIQVLAMLTIEIKQTLSLIIYLRILHEILSSLRVDKVLQL